MGAEAAIGVTHVEAKILDIAIVVLDVHEVVIHLLVDLLQVVELVCFLADPVQESLGERALEEAAREEAERVMVATRAEVSSAQAEATAAVAAATETMSLLVVHEPTQPNIGDT